MPSRAEKRAAALAAIAADDASRLCDRELARRAGVSHTFVRSLRLPDDDAPPARRLGKRGCYPARRARAELPAASPPSGAGEQAAEPVGIEPAAAEALRQLVDEVRKAAPGVSETAALRLGAMAVAATVEDAPRLFARWAATLR